MSSSQGDKAFDGLNGEARGMIAGVHANADPRFAAGEGGRILNSMAVALGGVYSGHEEDGRFLVDPTEIQLFGESPMDSAGINGFVRVGLSWEFYDKVTRNF